MVAWVILRCGVVNEFVGFICVVLFVLLCCLVLYLIVAYCVGFVICNSVA